MAWLRNGARAWLAGLCLLAVSGCGSGRGRTEAPAFPYRGLKLTVGVVGDPRALEVLSSALVGEWSATRKAEIVVEPEPVAAKDAGRLDVILFSGDHLGELIDADALWTWPEKLVHPPAAPEEETTADRPGAEKPADPFRFSDVVQPYRDQVSKYGMDRVGVPLGGTGLVLAYNKQAFERAENRQAADQGHLVLAPPRTWKDLDALARFFEGRDWDGDGKADHGIALVLGGDAEGLGNATYMARAAALGQHRDQYSFLFDSDSMAPRVASPPFVEALADLLALRKYGPAGVEGFDPERARRALAEGEVALLIDRAEMSAAWSKTRPIGVAPLPGSDRVFEPNRGSWDTPDAPNQPSYLPQGGGWVVGVSRTHQGMRREAAVDFAKYLTGPDLANQVRSSVSFALLPVRGSALGLGPASSNGVDAQQWADAVGRTLTAPRVVPGLRIPGADGYLSDLAAGRVAALKGQDPEQALRGVAKAWQERTQRLGTARQAWHYHRSLNTLVTTPEPPPR